MFAKFVITNGIELRWTDTPENPIIFDDRKDAVKHARDLSGDHPHDQFYVCQVCAIIGPTHVSQPLVKELS